MPVIVLMGAPGSGKGTQGDLLVKKFAYKKISTGDVLREHIKQKSTIGKQVEEVLAAGKLVSDELLLQMITEVLANNKMNTVILDGYPRSIEQAKTLTSILGDSQPVVLHIDLDQSLLTRRLLGRRICSSCGASYHLDGLMPRDHAICDHCGGGVQSRPDDVTDKVVTRLEVYREETSPVLAYYKQLKLLKTVDGSLSPDEVHEKISTALKLLGL